MDEADDLYHELSAVSEHFRRTIDGADRRLLRQISPADKGDLSHLLGRVTRSVAEARRALVLVCSFCRKPGGAVMSDCEQCGQPVCSLCGRDVNGKVLHMGVCTTYHEG